MRPAHKVPQSGGTMLRGVQTHVSRKRPPSRLDRKRWRAGAASRDE